eukprot:TRINITY_DN70438_c0_g1_i1.p1 TRINITY_DN70438_c0_g1~~TRINITY_DN70438_c0_g1_i1.p1  ORF type:complete len:620 (-),score=99.75 TRINITY_DN70438_c0_g1_i1:87-1946(-)
MRSAFNEEDFWMELWKMQREEVSHRIQLTNQEKLTRKDLMYASRKPPTAQPQSISNSRGNFSQPSEAQLHQLRERIGRLSEMKQVLLSEFVGAKWPHAITKDSSGLATIDPYNLSPASVDAVLAHIALLEHDERSSLRRTNLTPTTPAAWQTGYVSDLPARGSGIRPNGTLASQPGSVRAGSRAAMTWEDFAIQPQPPATEKAGSHFRQPRWEAPTLPSPPRAVPVPPPAIPPLPRPVPSHFAPMSTEREELARQIQSLSEAQQRTVAQEVRLFCPSAISHSTPGFATINTSDLDSRTLVRIKALVSQLIELSQDDAMRERERSVRQQLERESFVARERARERERLLDLEYERRIREQQIKRDLEFDVQRVRNEIEQERRELWLEDDERRHLLLSEREPQAKLGLPAPADTITHPTHARDDEAAALRAKLADILRKLSPTNVLAFADFTLQLDPGALDLESNSIQPSRFAQATLPLAVTFACQLKAQQDPAFQIASQQGPLQSVPERKEVAPAPVAVPAKRETALPPLPRTASGSVLASAAAQVPDDSMRLSKEELADRERLANAIASLSKDGQRSVCLWIKENAPQAIASADGKTSIETALLPPQSFNQLRQVVAQTV